MTASIVFIFDGMYVLFVLLVGHRRNVAILGLSFRNPLFDIDEFVYGIDAFFPFFGLRVYGSIVLACFTETL